MDVLTDLFTPDQRERQDDFVRRYDEGAPWENVRDDEALEAYREVAPRLSDESYRESAQEAFARLTPEQRLEFGRWLRQRSRQQSIPVPDLDRDGIDDRLEDAGFLADATTQLRREQPGFLDGLLGNALGGGVGMSGTGSGLGDLLSSPIARAAIGGIAAMALSKVMRR